MSIMACSRVVVLVVTFAIFIFTRPDFRDFFRSIGSHIYVYYMSHAAHVPSMVCGTGTTQYHTRKGRKGSQCVHDMYVMSVMYVLQVPHFSALRATTCA